MARTYKRDSKGRFAKTGSTDNPSGGRISVLGRLVLGYGPSVRGAGITQSPSAARKSVAGKKVRG